MANVTIKLTRTRIQEMRAKYKNQIKRKTPPYAIFSASVDGATITAYESGKVLFQGLRAEELAKSWSVPHNNLKSKNSKIENTELPQGFSDWSVIGSDEVGKGSYFGPMTVAAVFVSNESIPLLKEIGVQDSKNLTDVQIKEIAQELIQIVPYSLLILWPEKYNVMQQSMTQGKMTAILHNHALNNVISKVDSNKVDAVLIDQFAKKKTYYNYLKDEADILEKNVYFATKGESRHLAVAAASIIARASFLESLKKTSTKYKMTLPSGANPKVDVIAAQFIEKYGIEELKKVVKWHFANTEKAKKLVSKRSRNHQ